MRIVEQTADRLVLKEGTVVISALCAMGGLIPATVAAQTHQWRPLVATSVLVLFGLVFYRASRVVVDRSLRTVVIVERSAFRTRRASIAFDDIVDVTMDEMQLQLANAPSTRLVLVTKTDRVPLASVYSVSQRFHALVRRAILEMLGRTTAAGSSASAA
jgi:hypothetical protein